MDVFVARQPIFDRAQKVQAYELLFRSGSENYFPGGDQNVASSRVIHDGLHVFGLDALAGGTRLYINITRDLLLGEVVQMLPPEVAVIELLETVGLDDEVLAACKRLRAAGYQIALDDFVFSPEAAPLIELADVIKVDWRSTEPAERAALVERVGKRPRLLAEKVETQEEFADAAALGYSLFQGYFFCRPQMIASKSIPASKLSWLQLLQTLNSGKFDIPRIESIVRQDVGLSVKLLRYLNAAYFPWAGKIASIRQALILIGEQPFRKWVSLMALAGLRHDLPKEIVVDSLLRAHFCEKLGPACGLRGQELDVFLTGLLSYTDVLLGRPMPEVLERLAISGAVQAALLRREGTLGAVLALVIAYDRGDWPEVAARRAELKLEETAIADAYKESAAFAQQSFIED